MPTTVSRMIAAIRLGPLVLDHLGQVGERPVGLLLVGGGAERRAVGVRPQEVDDAGDRRLAAPAARLTGERHGRRPWLRGSCGTSASTLSRPVWARAMRMAFSLASAPPLVKNTRSSPSGAWAAISRAASLRVWLANDGRHRAQPLGLLDDGGDHLRVLVPEVEVHELRREVEPAVAVVVPELATRPRRRAGTGLIRCWADQEWKTWARSAADTSALVGAMGSRAMRRSSREMRASGVSARSLRVASPVGRRVVLQELAPHVARRCSSPR